MCQENVISSAERIIRSARDPFFPESEYEGLASAIISHWQEGVEAASSTAIRLVSAKHGQPEPEEIGRILRIYSDRLSGSSFVRGFRHKAGDAINSSYHKAKREVNAEAYDQTKNIHKEEFTIEVVSGMSEMEAINQLSSQVFIAAGEFWDKHLQDSIKRDLQSILNADLNRDEFADKLKGLIGKRLTNAGGTFGDSYFRQLAHLMIVRTRTIGKFARAKDLSARGYKLINPLDKRTSDICRTLVQRGTVYTLTAAQSVVNDLLTTTSTAELKRRQPFIMNVSEVDNGRTPFPPLHWGDCRTTIRIIFV